MFSRQITAAWTHVYLTNDILDIFVTEDFKKISDEFRVAKDDAAKMRGDLRVFITKYYCLSERQRNILPNSP